MLTFLDHAAERSRAEKNLCSDKNGLLCSARFCGDSMPQLEARARVLEEWFRLPESRRLHATDAVAFAFRLLQDRPEMFARAQANGLAHDQAHDDAVNHDDILNWLLPYLNRPASA